MISTLLLFPIIASIFMLIARKQILDKIMLNIYAVIHFIITTLLVFNNSITKSIPYFAVDNTNKIFLLILSFVFLMVTIYNNSYSKHLKPNEIIVGKTKIDLYWFMILAFVWAMTGTVLSTDLGIAWVFVEATTLSSAYLIFYNKTKNAIEAAWKYVFICSIGIALAFVGIIFLNISTGGINSLNYAVLYKEAVSFDPIWLKLSFVFMAFGFGAKMGLAPVHFWLPDAHSESPSPISALLSATLLNSAFLVIIRVFKILTIADCSSYARIILFIMGFLSLFVTAVFVYHIKNYKRMLAYSSIENMGILAIGVALGGMAYYAVVLHLIGHSLAKASFFLTSGNILELFETKRTKSIKALVSFDNKTGWLWIVSFLAICAFPTSILFISEFLIIKEMIYQKHFLLCGLFVILLTIILYGISRVVVKMSFGEKSKDKIEQVESNKPKLTLAMYLPQIIMLILVFILGIYIPPFLNNVITLTTAGL